MNANLVTRLSLVALLYLLLSSPLLASVTLVDDYIQRSGFAEQLGQIAGKGLRQIEEAQAEPQAQPPRLTDDQMERLRSAVKVAFAADRLRSLYDRISTHYCRKVTPYCSSSGSIHPSANV